MRPIRKQILFALLCLATSRAQEVYPPQPVGGLFAAKYDPAVSPNGRYLAYTSSVSGNEDIWIIDLQNGRKRRITEPSSSEYSPCFYGNDKILFVSTRDNSGGMIFRIDIGGGDFEPMVGGAGYFDSPSVSADRRLLAYVHNDEQSKTRIYIYDLNKKISRQGPLGVDPSFSNSGADLVFIVDKGDSSRSSIIGVYNIEKDSAEYIDLGGGVYSDPSFLPGDQSILLARYGFDSNGDGYVNRQDSPDLVVVNMNGTGKWTPLYYGFHFKEPAVYSDDRVYVVSRELDIFIINAHGPISRSHSAKSQAEICDSLIAASDDRPDSILTASSCLKCYGYFPDSCAEYILKAADIYGTLGMTQLSLEILGSVSGETDPDFAAGARLASARTEFHSMMSRSADTAWTRAYGRISDILQTENLSIETVKSAYITGISLSHTAGRINDSNSLIVEALLAFTGDDDFTAVLEMWRLRNIASSFKGDPGDIAPLFVDYIDRFRNREALTDSVISGLIGLSRPLESNIAIETLEKLRSQYPDLEKLAAASSIEQSRRFEDSGQMDMAEWKCQEALAGCPDCRKERFESFAGLANISLLRDNLESSGIYFDSAEQYRGAIKSQGVLRKFDRDRALLMTARGYRVIDENPVAAAEYFNEALRAGSGNAFAIWGLAKSLAQFGNDGDWRKHLTAFTDESGREYFLGLRDILDYESKGKVSSLESARTRFKRAIELDYKFAPPYLSLAYVDCVLEKRTGGKEALYEEAVENSIAGLSLPDLDRFLIPAFKLNLGEAYFGLGRYKEAYDNYTGAQEYDSDPAPENSSESYLSRMGESGFQIDSLQSAIDNYTKLYRGAVKSGDIASQARQAGKLGMIHQADRDYLRAIEYYEIALPYYLSREDHIKSMNLLKAQALCYEQYGDSRAAAEKARQALREMAKVKKRPRLVEDRLRIDIKPLGITLPIFSMEPMIYGGSIYPLGFTRSADEALISSISAEKSEGEGRLVDERNKIEILSEGKERGKTTGLYNNLGIDYFNSGYLDSAAISFYTAYGLSMKGDDYTSALKNLENLAITVIPSSGQIDDFPDWLGKLRKESDRIYGKFGTSDYSEKATVGNILGITEFMTAILNIDSLKIEARASPAKFIESVESEAREFGGSLESIRNRFREGISDVAFGDEPALSATLSLNAAVMSFILGDNDGYVTAISRAIEEASLSQSERVYARAAGIRVLTDSGDIDSDSVENALSSFESLPPGPLNSIDSAVAARLYNSAIESAWNSGDTISALDYLERGMNFRLLNVLSLIPPELHGDDLLKAYVRQFIRYQNDLNRLRGKERKQKAVGITGQVGLKKTRDDILSLNSRLLELLERIRSRDPRLVRLLQYDTMPVRLLKDNVPSDEISITAHDLDGKTIFWAVDSMRVEAIEAIPDDPDLISRLKGLLRSKRTVTVSADSGIDSTLRSKIATEIPEVVIKESYSVNEEYGNRNPDPVKLGGVAVVRLDGSIIPDSVITELGATNLSAESLVGSGDDLEFGWVVFDGVLHYDQNSPLMSFWAYESGNRSDSAKSRIYVYELFDNPSESFGAVATGIQRIDNRQSRWAVSSGILDSGFRALIAIDSSVSDSLRLSFVRGYFGRLKTDSPIEACRKVSGLFPGKFKVQSAVEYYGENGWNESDRKTRSRQWFDHLIARGDSAVSSGRWREAALAFDRAGSQIQDGAIGPQQTEYLSRKIIEVNLKIGKYDKALDGQKLLIDKTSDNTHELISLWQEYREMAREAKNTEQSIKASNELLALSGKIGDSSMLAESNLHLAEDYYSLGEFSRSAEYAEISAGLSNAGYDTLLLAESYFLRGKAMMKLGLSNKALPDLVGALDLNRDINNVAGEFEVLSSLGELYTGVGNYTDGRRALAEAIDYYDKLGDQERLNECKYNIAVNYLGSGMLLDAERETGEMLREDSLDAKSLILASIISRRRGLLETAYGQAVRAANLTGPMGDPRELSEIYENLGDILYALGDSSKSVEQYRLAIEFYGRDSTLGYPGLLYYKLSSATPGKGLGNKNAILTVREKTEDEFVKNLCSYYLAQQAGGSGERDASGEYLTEIINSDERQTARILRWRAAYLSRNVIDDRNVRDYRVMADSIYALFPPEPSYVKDEYHLGEAIKDVRFESGDLRITRGDIEGAIDHYEKGKLGEISSLHFSNCAFDSLERELIEDLNSSGSDGDFPQTIDKFTDLRPQYSRLWGIAPYSTMDLQDNLESGQAVIRYFQFPEKIAAFYIDSDTLTYNIINMDSRGITDVAARFQDRVRNPISSDSLLEAWYDSLIAPFGEFLEDKDRILIVPDGPLISLPFSALKMPEADFLGEMYDLRFTDYLPGRFPENREVRMVPCSSPDDREMAVSIVNAVTEIYGGCRGDSTAGIVIEWGNSSRIGSTGRGAVICDLKPLASEEYEVFQLEGLLAARDGNLGLVRTLWTVPNQALSYYYNVFLGKMISGEDLAEGHKAASAFLFGRYRGAPYYWAFSATYMLN